MRKYSKKILNDIKNIAEIRSLTLEDLKILSDELRQYTIDTVANTGGHLGAGLGVVELTVALHYIFNTPKDLLIWDVGHQAYPHKILTDRKDLVHSLRQKGGLSGFTKREESIFDPFGAGHSSTSISAALGMAVARDYNNEQKEVIAVIGDGAISAGMAYEAMNNAGSMHNRLIVILNDNDMSIAKPVGAMNKYLTKLISSRPYLRIRDKAKKLPSFIKRFLKGSERRIKEFISGGNFFEEMGFYYIGPIDGHDLETMCEVFSNVKNDQTLKGPILIHVKTEKGRGFHSIEECAEKYHAVSKFDPVTKVQQKSTSNHPSYTSIFAKYLIEEASKDKKIVAITAAMPSGTGLDKFAKSYPNRYFDVGIAEQHAVTFAAGMAAEGLKPFVAIYSTFLQRAYDQVIHDVALQKLPVRFAIDRAGYVGADGPTHAGTFDLSYLACLPNFIIMAPSDEVELARVIKTASNINDVPCAFRYPRGSVTGISIPENIEALTIGKGRIIREGKDIAILSLGTRLGAALRVAELLEKEGIFITIADARFVKPLDQNLIKHLVKNHRLLLTVEEGAIGGFAAQVNEFIINQNLLTQGTIIKNLHYPDIFMDQGLQEDLNEEAGVGVESMLALINDFLNQKILELV